MDSHEQGKDGAARAPAFRPSTVANDQDEKLDKGKSVSSNEITCRNSIASPLLRLPAELRNHIWEFAFGHRTVHPRNACRGWLSSCPDYKHEPMHYKPCEEVWSDIEVYRLSVQGASTTEPFEWKARDMMKENTRTAGYHCCVYPPMDDEAEFDHYPTLLVPLVCAQLYREANPTAWQTTVFAFHLPDDFYHFIQSSRTRVDLVTQLSIIQDDKHCSTLLVHDRKWQRALDSCYLAKLTSLKGVNLVLRSDDFRPSNTNVWSFDVLNHPPRQFSSLPPIIRQLQKCSLKDGCTTVLLPSHPEERNGRRGYFLDPNFTILQRRELAEAIRSQLLNLDHNTTLGD